MILSVVVPKIQKGQWERIEEEFKFVEYELIISNGKDISKIMDDAKGSFVLFLEEDSAFYPGQLNHSLDIFRQNLSYRKLAMVSSAVDYDSIVEEVGFGYKDKVTMTLTHGDEQYPVSIGYIYGAIIRSSAIRKAISSVNTKKDPLYQSVQLSDFFWSNGLRIELNPGSIYYAPPDSKPIIESYVIKSNAESLKVWQKEFIL